MAVFMTGCWGNASKKSGEAAVDVTEQGDSAVELFNGENFEGWRGYNRADMPAKWTVEDGCIKINGGGTGEGQTADGGDIIFATPFKNFKLTFEYKVSKGGNSGVFFYAKEIPGQPIYISAPEYQILDNANHLDANLGVDGNRQSASLYDMRPAKPQNAKPFGEWNTGGITVKEGTVIHYQNDVPVVEYHLWNDAWVAMIEKSKFSSTNPDWPMAFELLTSKLGKDDAGNLVGGYIGLQDHGNDVWFRNLRVEEF